MNLGHRNEAALTADGLSLAIDGLPIVESIGLDVAAGKTVGIVGPNGSGKSTFVRLLYRALTPDSGAVWIGGRDLLAMPAAAAAHHLAAVPQEAVSDNGMRVIDLVMIGRIPYRRGFGGETSTDRSIVAEALARVGMDGMEQRRVRTLSGGERQRTLIARALAQQTSVIVLDEPTNHLDLHYQHELLGLLRDLPVTVVIVLHDINLALEYCDELVVLDDGRIYRSGRASDVLTPEVVADVFGVHAHPVINPTTGRPHLLISARPICDLNKGTPREDTSSRNPHADRPDADGRLQRMRQ